MSLACTGEDPPSAPRNPPRGHFCAHRQLREPQVAPMMKWPQIQAPSDGTASFSGPLVSPCGDVHTSRDSGSFWTGGSGLPGGSFRYPSRPWHRSFDMGPCMGKVQCEDVQKVNQSRPCTRRPFASVNDTQSPGAVFSCLDASVRPCAPQFVPYSEEGGSAVSP